MICFDKKIYIKNQYVEGQVLIESDLIDRVNESTWIFDKISQFFFSTRTCLDPELVESWFNLLPDSGFEINV